MRGSDSVLVVYDDSLSIPVEVSSVTGVTRFGDMMRHRQRLSSAVRALSDQAGLGSLVHARDGDDLAALGDQVRRHSSDALYLLLPSNLAPTADWDEAVSFLKKLRYLTEPVSLIHGDEPTGACLLDHAGLLSYLDQVGGRERDRYLREHTAGLPSVQDALRLADLRELAVALEFLSASFSARHFNELAEQDRYTVVKRSSDREKIRREFHFFEYLPESIQPWFMQPFDFREDASEASYRMRRLFIPDLAVQWVHHAFSPAQFEQLLDHLFHFLNSRPRRDVGNERAERDARTLYVDKVDKRVEELLELDAGRDVDATLEAGGVTGGVGAIHERYHAARGRLTPRRSPTELCISHGDFCFSNILYSASTQAFYLVDPRGADREEGLYLDPMYDVAKLSHSVLGGYDFIIAGLFDLVHEDDLRLSLEVDRPPAPELETIFLRALERNGYDVRLVRVYEASLFLSMLPLHLEEPKRVVAFALRAKDILDELESA